MKVKNQKESKKDEFRKEKETGHPAYIYAKVGNKFKYIGITHSKITEGMENIKLDYSDVSFKDNGKLKLLIIVGTRPEIIRLSAVINKCREYFDCVLAHTGQNYDYNLNGVFF